MQVACSAHAREMLAERNIESDWVMRAVENPDAVEDDPFKTGRKRAFLKIPEKENRILRVVYIIDGNDVRIVTVFFDRGRAKQSK
jgi:hypothetical protein